MADNITYPQAVYGLESVLRCLWHAAVPMYYNIGSFYSIAQVAYFCISAWI